MTEGRKDDAGKLRYDLLPPYALEEVVRVYTLGAGKYGDNNYRRGINWSRVYAAMLRHLEAWRRGEEIAPDDGQLHLASVAWGALTLMEYARVRREFDDRPAHWDEQWKSVPGWDGYEMSDSGRARKLGVLLARTEQDNGYHVLHVWSKGQRRKLYVHRLVAELFIRPLGEKEMVNHRDGNRANNWWGNLEIVDAAGNILDAYRKGRRARKRPGVR